MTSEKHLGREFLVLRNYIFCYIHFFNFVHCAAFEIYGMFDLVLKYNRVWAQKILEFNLYS